MDAKTTLDFDLLISPAPEGGYRARVVSSPAGAAANTFVLPFSDLEIENLVLRMGQVRTGLRGAGSPQADAAREFGGRLFEAVFAGELERCWRSSLEGAASSGAPLRLRLRLTDAPELFDLPWEYLYDPAADRFVALSSKTPLVRYLELAGAIDPLLLRPPLRILALIASPSDLAALDVEREWTNLRTGLADLLARGAVELVRCAAPTLAELQRTLRRQEVHIFHFVGHGAYDGGDEDGVLLFAGDQGRSHPVSGRQLGALLHDEGQLRLAVLNACEGGRASRQDPFAGVGQSLLRQGVPAVIAMQFAITDAAAAVFAHEFYAAVADGYSIDSALAEARKAIFAQLESVEWGTPVLYMRAVEGHVFDLIPQAAMPVSDTPLQAAASQPPAAFASPIATAATPAVKTAATLPGAVPTRRESRRGIGLALLAGALLLVAVAAGSFLWSRAGSRPAAATSPATSPPAAVTPAAGTGGTAVPSFHYTFDDGADTWTGNQDFWRVVQDETGNPVYQGSAPEDGVMASEPPSKAVMSAWRNYAVHLRLRALRQSANPDLPEVWITTRAPYEESPEGCSFYNTLLDFRTKRVALGKSGYGDECNYIPLASESQPLLELGAWHEVVVEMEDENLSVAVDGRPVINLADEDVQQGYLYFTVGDGAIVQFDDIEVFAGSNE